MAGQQFSVFVSYRRDDGAVALFIASKLEAKGRGVFIDVSSLPAGPFDESLLRAIANAPDFVVVLSPNALDRCVDDQDWMRREISHAIKTSRNIIPVFMPGFKFPQMIPPEIEKLMSYQGVPYSHAHAESTINKIIQLLTSVRNVWLLRSLIVAAAMLAAFSVIYFSVWPRSSTGHPGLPSHEQNSLQTSSVKPEKKEPELQPKLPERPRIDDAGNQQPGATDTARPKNQRSKNDLTNSRPEPKLAVDFQTEAADEERLRTCWNGVVADYPSGVTLRHDIRASLAAMEAAVQMGQAALKEGDSATLRLALRQLHEAKARLPKEQC